jgi:hypothetical protein
MKSLNIFKNKRPSTTLALLAALMLALQACDKKIPFLNSSVVPAAEGTVIVKPDKNNNYKIKLHIVGLAEPKRLDPPREYYVVWIQTENDGKKNVGQLKSSSGMLSKTRRSSLETTSPFKPNTVMITAEDDPGIQSPNGHVVLKTAMFDH